MQVICMYMQKKGGRRGRECLIGKENFSFSLYVVSEVSKIYVG